MDNLALYILKSTLVLSLMYLVYWLFLRRETFLTFNRIYLIAIALLSIALPAFEITFPDFLSGSSIQYFALNNIISDNPIISNMTATRIVLLPQEQIVSFNPIMIFVFVYLAGAGFFSLLTLIRFIQLAKILQGPKFKTQDGLKILDSNPGILPFSFFHYVFINKNKYTSEDFNQILRHEMIHIEQGHTLDLLFFELIQIFHWFNPIIWAMRISLRSIHEYLADRGVLESGYDKISYQYLILRQTVGLHNLSFVNTFVFSQTKRRIFMLNRRESSSISKIKAVFILPALLILFCLFSAPSGIIDLPVVIDSKVHFTLPLKQGYVTQKYAMGINPFTKKAVFHNGMDIAAPLGTNIYAAEDGTILSADSTKGHGNKIVIQHANGFTTHYSHLDKIMVSEEENVKTGAIVGLVGSTGLSTAPHLHFEIRQNGETVDPSEYLDFSVYNQK